MVYRNAEVFLEGHFVKADITTENGIISGIYRKDNTGETEKEEGLCRDAEEIIDCEDMYIIPGLVDIHTHGCMGYDFSTADRQALSEMTRYYYENGITHVLATTMTNEPGALLTSAKEIGEYRKEREQGHAVIEGIYMEGPFLGQEKKGAHDENYLMPLNEKFLHDFETASGNAVKVVAFDPCLWDAKDFVQKYRERYVLSIAHSSCDYDAAKDMMESGAIHVTHLYNAMNGFEKRSPGIVGAFLDHQKCFAEIICDGIHIHPSVLRAMFRLEPDRLAAVSDSMSATGLTDGIYALGGQKVYVKDGRAALEDGTIAGSTTNLFSMMRKLAEYGVKLETAVAAVTINPARSAHLDHVCGSISPGRRADFIVMDRQLNILMRVAE